MRKYLVLFNCNSSFANNYAEVKSTSKESAYYSAIRLFKNGNVANVISANEYGYNYVKLYNKTLVNV